MQPIEEIKPQQSIELLKSLHILTRDGKINQDSRRKLKQVYHLYQFIEPILTEINQIKEDFEKINTKIVFATIIELSEEIVDKKEIEKIILIKVPTEIYPELRKIFISIFESSGFKDIKISEKVDFQKLYNLKKIQ